MDEIVRTVIPLLVAGAAASAVVGWSAASPETREKVRAWWRGLR